MDRVRTGENCPGSGCNYLSDGWSMGLRRHFLPCLKIEPFSGRIRDGVDIHHLSEWRRCHQQTRAEKKFRVEIVEAGIGPVENLWELKKHWPHQGKSGARCFVGECIDVWQQRVARLDVA